MDPPSGTDAVNINTINTFKVGDMHDSREILFKFAKTFSRSNVFTVHKLGKIIRLLGVSNSLASSTKPFSLDGTALGGINVPE